jgi:lipopolysaccharide/colanic/teichoic acid biosynthesis glycosyltransferase
VYNIDFSLKRIFDFLVSLTGILMLSPLFLLLACLIKLFDHGPVFFMQKRVGERGRLFDLYKFRTMKPAAGYENGIFEPGNSQRITTLGKFLRKAKIDELPQLINVLKGEMSIVGPRPEVEKWVAVYPEKWQRILTVKPGITDRASIEFRNEEELLSQSINPEYTYMNLILPRKLDLCLDYVDNHRPMDDVRILLLTFKTVLFK